MKNARMLILVAVIVSVSQVVSGQDRSRPHQEQVKRDQLRIAVQQICPISGNNLVKHVPSSSGPR